MLSLTGLQNTTNNCDIYCNVNLEKSVYTFLIFYNNINATLTLSDSIIDLFIRLNI